MFFAFTQIPTATSSFSTQVLEPAAQLTYYIKNLKLLAGSMDIPPPSQMLAKAKATTSFFSVHGLSCGTQLASHSVKLIASPEVMKAIGETSSKLFEPAVVKSVMQIATLASRPSSSSSSNGWKLMLCHLSFALAYGAYYHGKSASYKSRTVSASMVEARDLWELYLSQNTGQVVFLEDSLNYDTQPPAEFCCPITGHIMTKPIIASDGHTYEKAALLLLYDSKLARNQDPVSPLTRAILSDPQFAEENSDLRAEIRIWISNKADEMVANLGPKCR